MKEFMKKATLLLLCIPSSCMVALLSSSVTYIFAEYAQYSESIVTMVLTLPNLTVMLGLILAPALLKKFPIKHLILFGVALFTVCNVLPTWCENFYLLLLLRGLSGIGCGLILPLQATFLATYAEKERATLMGLSATVGCLVAALVVSISGVIAEINWRYVFLLYLINAIIFVLTILFLPKHLAMEEDDLSEDVSYHSTEKLTDYKGILFFYYLLLVGSYLFVPILTAEIAPYLENVQLGGPTESGLVISVSLVGSMLSGLILGKYLEILKSFAMPSIFLGSAIGFVLLWIAPSLIFVMVAAFILGIFSALVACVINYELSRALPLHLFTGASAGVNLFTFVLQFVAPSVFLGVLAMVPSGSFRIVFLIYTLIQTAFIAVAYILPKILLKQK